MPINRSRIRFAALLGAAFVAMATPGLAVAAPEPEPVPVRWEFDFRPDALRLAQLEVEDEGPVWFAFMTYRVANHSGEDRMLAPLFELGTDEGHVIRSGREVPPEITSRVMVMLGDPLIEDQLAIVGSLLQGIENTRRGVVVWRLPALDMDELIVFAAGLSGESEAFFTTDPATGESVRHVLRKTRMLRFAVPGQITPQSPPTPEQIEARWILR